MKKTFLTMAIVFIGVSCWPSRALAAQAEFQAGGLVGFFQSVEGIEQVFVSVEKDGRISIRGSGFINIIDEPVVIADQRPIEGNLILRVGVAELTVGSRPRPDGTVSYSLKIAGQSIQLKAILFLQVK